MNVRKLLARLNPKAMPWPEKRGALPVRSADPITNEDVIGALGMVKHRLGREVLCHMWWPDGARLSVRELRDLVAAATRAEHQRRAVQLELARLELLVDRETMVDANNITPEHRARILRGEARVEACKSLSFPPVPEMRVAVREAVLDELLHPHRCHQCEGMGEIPATANQPARVCEHCGGRAIIPISDRQRGERIGRDESVYRRMWRPLYEWTYDTLVAAENEAANEMAKYLRSERERVA